MEAGGVGVISVLGNAYPDELAAIVRCMQEGKTGEARNLNDELRDLYHLIFVDGNPSGIKALMNIQGRLGNYLRLPLGPASDEPYSRLQQAVLEE